MPATPEVIKAALPAIPNGINIHSAPNLPEPQIPQREENYYADVVTFGVSDDKRTSKLAKAETYLRNNPMDSIGIVTPGTDVDKLAEPIDRTRTDKFPFNPNRRLIIAPDSMVDAIKSQLPDLPVLPIGMLEGLINMDKASTRYGFDPSKKVTAGMEQTLALVVQRLILDRVRGGSKYQHIYSIDERSEKIAPSPIKLAALPLEEARILYAQRNRGVSAVNFASSPNLRKNPHLRGEIVQYDLEPSDNVAMYRALIDNMLRSSSQYGQNLLNLIVAKEYSQVLQLPLGKVVEIMELEDMPDSLKGQKKKDYDLLLTILTDVLGEGKIINITPDQIKALNAKAKQNPRLGQFLPSILAMMREGMINFDQVAEVEKRLYAKQFQGATIGIPNVVGRFMPENMVIPGSQDNVHILLDRIDVAHEKRKARQPQNRKTIGQFSAYDTKTRERFREADFNTQIDDERGPLNKQLHNLFYFNAQENIVLGEPGTEPLIDLAERQGQKEGQGAVLYGFSEYASAGDVARYWSTLFRPENVSFASPDAKTLMSVAPFCNLVVNRYDVLQFVDDRALREMGIIPSNMAFLPSNDFIEIGGKGTDLLASYLALLARGVIDMDSMVYHGDSDEKNLDRLSLFYRAHPESIIPPYMPGHYMLAASALMPPSYDMTAIQIARTGPQHKAEVQLMEWTRMVNNQYDPIVRNIGRAGKRTTWKSPGEGAANFYSYIPWETSTAFDLHRYTAAYYRERDMLGPKAKGFWDGVPNTRFAYVQVVDPAPKLEIGGGEKGEGGVPEFKDVGEVVQASNIVYSNAIDTYMRNFWLKQAGAPALDPAFPPEFTEEHIKEWNRTFAGKEVEVVASHPPDIARDPFDGSQHISAKEGMKGGHKPNHTIYRAGSLLLPSIWWMDQHGLIKWDGIRNIRNHSYNE